MTRKILIISRPKNRLEIQDENDEFSFILLYDVTHISKDGEGVYEIFDANSEKGRYKGVITNVKEIREEWK